MKLPLAILLTLALAPAVRGSAATQPRPNIVFILADDLGYMDIGANNPKTFYETPNLDALAKKGMRFTQAYAACPVCSPTRASLSTGRWPQRTGVTDFIGAAQPDQWKRPTRLLPAPYADRLALEETTLAEVLKAAGYATMHAGKWHLGGQGYWPENQGFDVNQGGIGRGGPYGGKGYFSPYGNPRLTDGPDGEHIADRLATECAKFIEANRDRPFFVSFWLYDVHTPHMTKGALRQKYEEKAKAVPHGPDDWGTEGERKVRRVQDHAVYAGMVETMDAAVGTVLAKLDVLGLATNTIVIFTSDNGGLSTSEGWPTSNLPLRGGKGWLYEGGVREPFLVCWPGVVKPGTISERLVSSPDLFPTLLAACGLPSAPSAADGVSFLATLRGEAQPARDPVFWHYPHYGNQGGFPGGAVRDGDWKLIERYEDGRLELYNLSADLSETTNLAARLPDKAKELHAKLAAWRKDVGALMPTANPSYQAATESVRSNSTPSPIKQP